MPFRVVVTEGSTADCKEAYALIDGLSAQTLLADRGYDADEIIETTINAKIANRYSTQKESQSSAGI